MKQKKMCCTYSGNVILSKVYGWKWQKYLKKTPRFSPENPVGVTSSDRKATLHDE
jgi:hypothetical protein